MTTKACFLVLLAIISIAHSSPLLDYVKAPDPTYSWVDLPGNNLNGTGWYGYALNMTSQTWLTENNCDRYIWWHHMVIVVPDNLRPEFKEHAMLYITGNKNSQSFPTADSEDVILASTLATSTGAIVGVIFQVPNQPIKFFDEQPVPLARSEDAMIAWTWNHFVKNTSDAIWLARLPMTKAAVRGLDTISAWSAKQLGYSPSKFIVAGASKRGWTTWTTGICDERVVAIIPLVLDELNLVKNLHHHYRAYGGWSFALEDYWKLNFTRMLDSPEVAEMMSIIDPISYPDQLARLPKMIVSTGGDEFLMPDNTRYFWDMLGGEKHFRLMPNCEHSMAEDILGVLDTVRGFATSIMAGTQRPQYDFIYSEDGTSITLKTTSVPSSVKLWWASTLDDKQRDFRLVTCPNGCSSSPQLHLVLWTSKDVEASSPGVYIASMQPPLSGWTAFVIEVSYPGVDGSTFHFSSGTSIIPQTFPFAECSGEDCVGTLV